MHLLAAGQRRRDALGDLCWVHSRLVIRFTLHAEGAHVETGFAWVSIVSQRPMQCLREVLCPSHREEHKIDITAAHISAYKLTPVAASSAGVYCSGISLRLGLSSSSSSPNAAASAALFTARRAGGCAAAAGGAWRLGEAVACRRVGEGRA